MNGFQKCMNFRKISDFRLPTSIGGFLGPAKPARPSDRRAGFARLNPPPTTPIRKQKTSHARRLLNGPTTAASSDPQTPHQTQKGPA
ncbi:hypothetical protein PCASD_18724 [Puccinia coronata f. sp. avenae]|uniref:Uncharacterized protein n=1 Tax=Puccinia coronata f. sp. avenae TaxID=200324 RepID=A0A2N5TVJ1_9BASI|nr:hypothetical protein PCASD_18724 [Puccinia coronata f. sp. avenae]